MMSHLQGRRGRLGGLALVAGGLLGLALGCGQKAGVPVVGTVTVDGKPLTLGTVSFRPDKTQGNTSTQEPSGEIDAQGSYKLYTAGKEGAPLGWYKIAIIASDPIDPKNPYALTKSHVKAKYNVAETSGLSIQVVDTPAPGAYDLKLPK
jgi:hypothetical protein